MLSALFLFVKQTNTKICNNNKTHISHPPTPLHILQRRHRQHGVCELPVAQGMVTSCSLAFWFRSAAAATKQPERTVRAQLACALGSWLFEVGLLIAAGWGAGRSHFSSERQSRQNTKGKEVKDCSLSYLKCHGWSSGALF